MWPHLDWSNRFLYDIFHCVLTCPLFDNNTPFMCEMIIKKDATYEKKQNICPENCLGLMLMWTHTRGSFLPCRLFLEWPWTTWVSTWNLRWTISLKFFEKYPPTQVTVPNHKKMCWVSKCSWQVTLRSWWCLGHHGRSQANNSKGYNKRKTITFLQWMDPRALCQCGVLFCTRWYNINHIVQHAWLYTQ